MCFSPHVTDIAFDMGIGDHVVGVTSYCILPPGETRPLLGNLQQINAEAVLLQKPDIVFYNQKSSDFDALRQLDPDIDFIRVECGNLSELRKGVADVGEAVGRQDLAQAMLHRIDAGLDAVREAVAQADRPSVLLLHGTEKPTTVGAGWLTDELIAIAGGRNLAGEAGLRSWASINLETVMLLDPDVLIVQTDPGEANVAEALEFWSAFTRLRAVRNGRLYVTDDRRLTIPGSKVVRTAEALAGMIHPERFEGGGRPASTPGDAQ